MFKCDQARGIAVYDSRVGHVYQGAILVMMVKYRCSIGLLGLQGYDARNHSHVELREQKVSVSARLSGGGAM